MYKNKFFTYLLVYWQKNISCPSEELFNGIDKTFFLLTIFAISSDRHAHLYHKQTGLHDDQIRMHNKQARFPGRQLRLYDKQVPMYDGQVPMYDRQVPMYDRQSRLNGKKTPIFYGISSHHQNLANGITYCFVLYFP